jgi:hypothetical protein
MHLTSDISTGSAGATTVVEKHEHQILLSASQAPEMVQITLPNLFTDLLAETPRINPHYEKVREESEKWINEYKKNPQMLI